VNDVLANVSVKVNDVGTLINCEINDDFEIFHADKFSPACVGTGREHPQSYRFILPVRLMYFQEDTNVPDLLIRRT